MMTPAPSQPHELRPLAFPERLRPQRQVRRRTRRRLPILLLLLPVLVLPLFWWEVQRVEVAPCPGLPEVVRQGLHELVGTSPLTLDLQWVRHQVEVWPGVASVQVKLELPGTLHVTARPQEIAGSLAIGRRWHAVVETGDIGTVLDKPQAPLLQGSGRRPAALRQGLQIAARISDATGYRVEQIRLVMPGDTEVTLVSGEFSDSAERLRLTHSNPVVIRVNTEASVAEQVWCEKVRDGWQPAPWTDLRMDNRMVVRESRDE
jgi:cell division septal protein FtsQ